MGRTGILVNETRLGRLLGAFLSEDAGRIVERDYSPELRRRYADEGIAMADGSYPIPDRGALEDAIGAFGRTDQPAATKRHIVKRARALDATDLLPAEWQGSTADEEADRVGLRDFTGDTLAIRERAVAEDGTVEVKIIQPGRGSSGYYPRSTLERDGPKVIKAGTKMYWDHPTPTDERERPERSLRDLAGEIVADAVFREDARLGPGLYARAKVFGPFRDAVEEMAPHIGVSIRGLGKQGDINENGEHITDAVTQLVAMHSVDFVTTPGAGGKVTQIFEAARGGRYHKAAESGREGQMRNRLREQEHDHETMPEGEALAAHTAAEHGGEMDMAAHRKAHGMNGNGEAPAAEARRLSESERRELRELRAKAERYEEADLLREASSLATRAVARFREIPAFVQQRIVREAVAAVPVKEGKIDIEAFDRVLREKLRAEVEYVARLTGAGEIRGAGGSALPFGQEKTEAEKLKEAKDFEESQVRTFRALGMSEKAAKIAAAGRTN